MDVKKLSKMTPYKKFCERVFSRARITVIILFLTNALGIRLIPWRPLPLVYQNQCKKKS